MNALQQAMFYKNRVLFNEKVFGKYVSTHYSIVNAFTANLTKRNPYKRATIAVFSID